MSAFRKKFLAESCFLAISVATASSNQALAACANPNTSACGSYTNSGSISGFSNTGTGTIGTLTNSGTINGTADAITNNGTITSLANTGTITTTGTITADIINNGGITTVTNSGLLQSFRRGFDNESSVTPTTFVNTAGGTIVSTSDRGQAIINNGTMATIENDGLVKVTGVDGNYDNAGTPIAAANPIAITNYGSVDLILNTGTISATANTTATAGGVSISGASATGILNASGTIGTLSNTGTITATGPSSAGIDNVAHAAIGTLNNSGKIVSTSSGIFNGGTITALTNSGTISAGNRGIYNGSAGTITTLTNSGLISGSNYALYNKGMLGTLGNSGTISGNIYVAHQSLTITGGSGDTYGTLSGGLINIANGNLIFAGGNQALADNITVNGGSGTVTNNGNLYLTTNQTVTGNYSQGSTGQLIIGVSSTSSGMLTVTGDAVMPNAHLVLVGLNGYRPASGSVYTLVSAQGAGTNFSGDVITIATPGYASKLTVVGDGPDPSLELLLIQNTPPSIYADTLLTQRSSFIATSDAISNQMQSSRGGPMSSAMSVTSNGYTFWMQGLGQFSKSSGGDAPDASSTGAGGIMGVSRDISPAVRLGFAVGGLDQNISASNGETYTGQSIQVQGYGSLTGSGSFLEAQLGGIFGSGTAKRDVIGNPQAQGDVANNGVGGSVKAGLRYNVSGWNIEPGITFGALSLWQGAITETGAGISSLQIAKGYLNSVTSQTGLTANRRFDLDGGYSLLTTANLGWIHEYRDVNTQMLATSIIGTSTFDGAPFGRDSAIIGANFELRANKALTIYANYHTVVDSHTTSQFVAGGFRVIW